MRISRVVIRNFRNLKSLDITLDPGLTCVVGENNTGKTNLLHALRLVLDGNVGTSSRRLSADDITDGVDVTSPMQVLVAVQFVDFDHPTEEDKIKELAFAQAWATEKNLAQVCYRFRPRPEIRELIESGEKKDGSLTISDYDWEWVGGAAVDKDGNVKELASVTWADNFSSNVSWNSMSAFDVVM
ncbi:MAG: AAA family ATPase, partial [candidate division WOR-3 bacterium]|nr:AAA family ATPase [candidate division WOR-3 bacterium]